MKRFFGAKNESELDSLKIIIKPFVSEVFFPMVLQQLIETSSADEICRMIADVLLRSRFTFSEVVDCINYQPLSKPTEDLRRLEGASNIILDCCLTISE